MECVNLCGTLPRGITGAAKNMISIHYRIADEAVLWCVGILNKRVEKVVCVGSNWPVVMLSMGNTVTVYAEMLIWITRIKVSNFWCLI